MANWQILKKSISDAISTNGNQEITGAVLQSTLNNIVNALGENAMFAGVATPSTSPGTPDGDVFYLAGKAGVYSNFSQLTLENGEVAALIWNGSSWTKKTISQPYVNNLTTGGADKALSAEMGKRINSQLNGETSITVIGSVADLSNLYINTGGSIVGTSKGDRHVCKYPISADKQYSLHIPQAGNEYCLMYSFSNTPDLAALEPSTNGEKTAEAFPEVGDNGEHTLEIDTTGKDYQYLVVCYDISGGSPTLTTEDVVNVGLAGQVEFLLSEVNEVNRALSEQKQVNETHNDKLTEYSSEIEEVKSILHGTKPTINVEATSVKEGAYINMNGAIVPTQAARAVCKFPIEKGRVYELTIPMTGNSYARLYGFSEKTDIDIDGGTGTYEYVAGYTNEVGNTQEYHAQINTTDVNQSYLAVCYTIEGGTPTLTTMTEAGGLLNEVEELQNKVSALENEDVVIDRSKPSIYLPSDIYILNDRTTQLFYRGLVRAVTPYIYDIKVMCSIGKTFPRYYEINTPPVGEYPLRIQLRDDELKVLAEAETTIHVVAAPSSLPSKNILCVGASATSTGHWPAELKRLMNDGTSPSGLGYTMDFVGRKVGSSDKTIHLEATGGWSWNTFITPSMKTVRFYISHLDGELAMDDKLTFGNATFTVIEINLTEGVGNIRCAGENNWTAALTPSIQSGTMTSAKGTELNVTSWTEENYAPFYNNTSGKIDFKSYADQYCDGKLDVLVCHLGVNSVLNEGTSPDTAISHAKNFIDGYLADFPNGKVVVSGIPMPDDGTNVYSNKYAEKNINRYGTLVSFLEYNKALRNLVSEYGSNVVWASSDIFFDTDYGYPKKDKDVNIRISDYKELIGTNGIHPVAKGSYMIADGILPTIIDLLV